MRKALPTFLLIAAGVAAPAWADDVNVSPVMVDFGRVTIGRTATVRVVFSNLTALPLTVSGGGGVTSPFSVSAGTCSGGVIPASSSCYFNYSFRPTNNDEVLVEDETSLSVTGGPNPEFFVPIRVRGRGMGNLADVAWTSVDFGDWFVGEESSVRLRILNTHVTGLTIAGGGFNVANGFSAVGCGLGSNPFGTSEVCDLEYRFLPPATGFRQNSTLFSLTTVDTPFVSQFFPVQVQGMGIATVPLAGVTPVEVDFGEVTIGRRPETPVDFTNFDIAALSLSGGGFNDNDDAFFGVGSGADPCTTSSIAPGDTCAVNYSFRPTEERDFAASTSLGFSKTGESQFTPLSFTGTGIGTLALVSPVLIDFGDVAPGTNMTVPVRITNTSEATLTGFIGGGVSGGFTKIADTCTTVAVGASCELSYRFTAFDSEPASATTLISFTNSSGIQPTHEIQLYANGAPEPSALALGVGAVAALGLTRRARSAVS
jgi:hypothetical protein